MSLRDVLGLYGLDNKGRLHVVKRAALSWCGATLVKGVRKPNTPFCPKCVQILDSWGGVP